jgi:hypothetical protein
MKVHMRQELSHLITLVGDGFSKVKDKSFNIWLKRKTPLFPPFDGHPKSFKERLYFQCHWIVKNCFKSAPNATLSCQILIKSHRNAEMKLN